MEVIAEVYSAGPKFTIEFEYRGDGLGVTSLNTSATQKKKKFEHHSVRGVVWLRPKDW